MTSDWQFTEQLTVLVAMDTGTDQLNPTEVVDLFNTVGVLVQSRLWLLERTGLLFNLGVEESILSLETDCESLGESFANLSNLGYCLKIQCL